MRVPVAVGHPSMPSTPPLGQSHLLLQLLQHVLPQLWRPQAAEQLPARCLQSMMATIVQDTCQLLLRGSGVTQLQALNEQRHP